jgi:glycosyltransferase involved in cell wall biosynthesis
MKILVVHEVSYLRKVIYEIHEFPELLALRGHNVTFLEFDEGARPIDLVTARDRVIAGRIHPEASIRLLTPHRFGIPQIDRLWAVFSSTPIIYRALRSGKFDVILNYAVPTFGLQVLFFAKMFRVPVVHRALDVSSKIRESFWNPLIAVFEKIVFRFSDLISTNNPSMKNYVLENLEPKHHEKIEVNYPPLDLGIFHRVPSDLLLRKSLGISDSDWVIMYMGTFFHFSGLDDVINELANAADPSVKLLLIGGGQQEDLLRELVAEHNLGEKVIFAGFIEFKALASYMCLADVAINPLRNELVASAAFPHKVLQYMAVELPVVSTQLAGLYEAFGNTSGILWSTDSRDVLRQALRLRDRSPQDIKLQVETQHSVLDNLFSTEKTVKSFELCMLRAIMEKNK